MNLSEPDVVLIVDDDETVLNVTQQIVKRSGFETAAASSGLEGINLFEERRQELCCVLLDMAMPEMDGAMTFEHLHRIDPSIPVILISGYSEQDLGGRFGDDRPFAFIHKPFSINELDEALHAAVARYEVTHRDAGRRRETSAAHSLPLG